MCCSLDWSVIFIVTCQPQSVLGSWKEKRKKTGLHIEKADEYIALLRVQESNK